METYTHTFSIAGVTIRMDTDRQFPVTPQFEPFITDQDPDFTVTYRQTDILSEWDLSKAPVHIGKCYSVHHSLDYGCQHVFWDPPRDYEPYGVTTFDLEHGKVQVDYLEKGARCVSQMKNSFFHMSLEQLLIHRGRICLHASCIDTEYGGILFVGPSGIGKSTQAGLWETYAGARQINGDRPILCKEGDQWMAWGSPFAGSSEIYLNESVPLSAIIFLQQAQSHAIRKIEGIHAVVSVLSQITAHKWDQEQILAARELAIDLVSQIPVLEFYCRPDESAVRFLHDALSRKAFL